MTRSRPASGSSKASVGLKGLLLGTRASGVLLVIALIAIWEISARTALVESTSWPPFSAVAVSFAHGIASGELPAIIAASLWRMARGYAAGVLAGVLIGLLMGTARPVRLTIEPVIELLRPIPAAAIIPPLIFILGIDDALKISIVALASFFPVVVNTLAGVLAVDQTHLKVARTFRLPAFTTIRKVVMPSALPYVLAGMRTSLAIALIVTVVAEMIAGSGGIGYHIVSMQYALRPADMYAAIVLLSLVGYLLNRCFIAWEARVIHWARVR